MSNTTWAHAGAVLSLCRYPVKSMMGEPLDSVGVKERGLSGDRVFGLVDRSDGKVATAKNPKKWPTLFAFRAVFVDPSASDPAKTSLRITLPDGKVLAGDRSDLDELLSKALNRDVTLVGVDSTRPTGWSAISEGYWPDIEGLQRRDTVAEFKLSAGTFFDCATVHLVTTATLRSLGGLYPEGRFESPRFRPNIVIEPGDAEDGFVEDSWIGRTLSIGDEVQLGITGPCGRCVMTTLAQADLPKDQGILRTIVRQKNGRVGVYAAVTRGGTIRRGDPVRLSPI